MASWFSSLFGFSGLYGPARNAPSDITLILKGGNQFVNVSVQQVQEIKSALKKVDIVPRPTSFLPDEKTPLGEMARIFNGEGGVRAYLRPTHKIVITIETRDISSDDESESDDQ